MKRPHDHLFRLALAICLAAPAFAAAAPNLSSLDPVDSGFDRNLLGVTRNDLPIQGAKAAAKPLAGGNPLWAIPLNAFTATRERPLFSPSRRPPAPVMAVNPQPASPTPPPIVEHPGLLLVGTVTGEGPGLAVFIDPTTHDVVRLRTGEVHRGWTLEAVEAKSATLHKGERSETLALPLPAATAMPAGEVSALRAPPSPLSAQPVRGAGEMARPLPQQAGCTPGPTAC